MPFFKMPPSEPKEGWVARLWREQKIADPALHDHSCHMSTVQARLLPRLEFPIAIS